MAIKYKKVSPCIWNDAKVNRLSVAGKLAFVYMLTHPQQTSVGAIRTTINGLGYEVKDLHMEAFAEVFAEGLAEASPEAPLVIFPNFLKYNHPESPNVANAWGKSFLDLPDCKLKDKLYSMVCQSLKDKGKGFEEGFAKGLGKDFEYSVPYTEAEAEAVLTAPSTHTQLATEYIRARACVCGNIYSVPFCEDCGVVG